jgi:DUF4097 and DUF4098 domain-containing protein YvlB
MKTSQRPIRRKRLTWLLAAALASPFAAPAFAATPNPPQSTTISADSGAQALSNSWHIANDATVEIHNVRGSVSISAGEAEQATLSGELGAGSRLVIDGNTQRLELRVDSDKDHGWFGNHGPRSDSNLVVKVPAGVTLRVGLVSADGRVSGIDGKSLNVECVSGRLTIESGSPQVDVESVSGDIIFRATRADAGYRAHLQTVSGDIEVSGASGRVKLDTVSGRARAAGTELQEFEAGTVSGNVELRAAIGKHGRVQVETMSGDIHAEVPASLSAHIEAESFSGRIRSDFGKVAKPEYGPGSSLDATVGDGDAQVTTKTFSGNVDIVRKP